jgi:DNA-binding NtrC family response regulator
MPTIIVVDDVPYVLTAVQTALNREGFDDVQLFENPQSALMWLRENKPDLIISDFDMPRMNGLKFLREAKKLHPDVKRILHTGGVGKEMLIKMINEIEIFRYVEKPWGREIFIEAVRAAFEKGSCENVQTT